MFHACVYVLCRRVRTGYRFVCACVDLRGREGTVGQGNGECHLGMVKDCLVLVSTLVCAVMAELELLP